MYRIEKLNPQDTSSNYFVAVYKNNECIGTCLTSGNQTPKDCAESVYTNREIDRMESAHYDAIDRSLDY